jgi:2,3-bisphosphoglycerate-dependent phosphoglycerate mutase
MPLLTLVRHGQSAYNLEDRFTGNLDVELTLQGEEEAKQAGVKLKGINYAVAYTSVLKRAKETLKIILIEINERGIPVIENAALNERMYGSLQGLNKAETIAKYGGEQVELWRRSFEVRPPEGESLKDTYNRTIPYYKAEIEPKLKANQNILIVAHGNSLRALVMYLESIDKVEIAKLNIPTGSPRNYEMDSELQVLHIEYL